MWCTTTFLPDVFANNKDPNAVIYSRENALRISFAGGGTDFPHWYDNRPGSVLCSTMTHYARVALYPRADKEVCIRSVDLGYMVNYHVDEEPIYDGMLDLAKAAIQRLGCNRGMNLDIHCDARLEAV